MRPTSRTTGAVVIALSTVALLSVTSPSGSAAPPAPQPRTSFAAPSGPFTGSTTVRLITGDTVRTFARADGAVTSSVSGRTPFIWSGDGSARYVVPRRPASRQPALDLSLFDVTALAEVTRHGRTPVVVRFAAGKPVTTVAGLHLETGAARAVGRSTVVAGTYGPHFAGFAPGDLRNVSSIRLDSRPAPVAAGAGVPTHTVQVHVARPNGSAADYAMVTVQATVDGDSYLEQADVDELGVASFPDVPEGEYSVVVQTFEKVLVNPQFDITSDQVVEFNLADATVKPQVRLPGFRTLWTNLTVERDPEQGFGIPFGSEGPHFSMSVQPTSGIVTHGALHTGVTATFVTGRAAVGYDRVANTADVRRGIPDHLSWVHHRRDFARVVDVFYANGPAAQRPLMVIPGNTRLLFSGGMVELMTPVPGRLHVWTEAGRGAYLQQTVFPLAADLFEGDNTQVADVRGYPRAGKHAPITFLHGPVGPGLELAPHSRFASGAWRRGDQLGLGIPIFGGAGATAFDFADPRDASWSLRQGSRLLARGHQAIYRVVGVPHGERTYRLSAETHPGKAWDLSTQVRDEWTFHSRGGKSGVPLLTPSYLPPTDLAGNMRPGHTGYRISFHSTPRSARVAQVSVVLSTNHGRTWRSARVTRTSGLTFHVDYRTPPAHGRVRYLSLRVTARDVHGNSVEETAYRAYRLS